MIFQIHDFKEEFGEARATGDQKTSDAPTRELLRSDQQVLLQKCRAEQVCFSHPCALRKHVPTSAGICVHVR
jgi:hypothetical protein